MARNTSCSFKVALSLSIIGTFVGIIVFAIFAYKFRNWNAALWGLTSGVFAFVTMLVHILYERGVWRIYPYRLQYLMLLGCVVQLAGTSSFIVYLTLAIMNHQGLTAYAYGYYITTVWNLMTWKWGFALFYFSRSYRRKYTDIYTIVSKDSDDESDPIISD